VFIWGMDWAEIGVGLFVLWPGINGWVGDAGRDGVRVQGASICRASNGFKPLKR
jgi:hypothetical protein